MSVGCSGLTARLGSLSWLDSPLRDAGIMLTTWIMVGSPAVLAQRLELLDRLEVLAVEDLERRPARRGPRAAWRATSRGRARASASRGLARGRPRARGRSRPRRRHARAH